MTFDGKAEAQQAAFETEVIQRLGLLPNFFRSAPDAPGLSMAIHELTTNAIKYGALSNEAGRIEIAWSLAPNAAGDSLRLRWQEMAGPRVVPPSRKGFGSHLIERSLAGELGGEVSIVYDPTVWSVRSRRHCLRLDG